MKTILIRLGLLVLIISGLAGCGGGSDGAAGTAGTNGTNGTNGNEVIATELTADQWLALKPKIDPASISVTINNGVPVVKFAVSDQYGNPLVGLGGQRQSSTALVPTNYNMFFTLAKLVPVTGGPSKWVNYLVTKPAATGTANASVADGMTWVGTYPTPDQEGTLVDNGNGTYQYTFLRNVAHAAAIVAGLTDAGNNHKADLGDVSYDPTLTHRLGIVIQGSQPGTGVNTPNAVQLTTPVPIVNTFNIGYDFVPNGGAVTVTRDIVAKASCSECHQGRGIGHVSSNSITTTNPTNGVPAGAFIGRNDPRLCVTCHTDQTKYGFVNVVEGVASNGISPTLTTAYMRTTTGEAAFTFPRMIHQTHMGAMNPVVPGSGLVKTGYNLNGHAKKSDGTVGCDTTSTNAGQCYNQLEYPQDVRNCTKCHDGSVSAVNKTADGDNWMNVPSRLACGSCHDGINFVTGAGITLLDRDTDVKAKVAIGTHASGHQGGAQADDNQCTSCHTAGNTAIYHGPFNSSYPATAFTGMPASAAPSLRTMSATITAATVSATDGSVTVNFDLADSAGAAVDMPVAQQNVSLYPTATTTNVAGIPLKSLQFTLAKLNPASNGASTSWKSYTGKCNVNNATPNPNMVGSTAYHNILQGYSEVAMGQVAAAQNLATNSAGKPAMAPGILMSLGGGHWSYKFALVNAGTHNADGSGDIRTITAAINLNTAAPYLADGVTPNPAAAYNWNAVPTCADAAANYDATLTHRVSMAFAKNDTLGADNVTNAYKDFRPDGGTITTTRNIVTMANCSTCHAGRKIHRGYATELCVTCHNQNTSDPSDADPANTVDLQRIVHKLHYKGTDFWLHGETFGTASMTGYPGNVMKCQVCHNENATKPGTTTKLENAANWYTTPTSRACGTCHDDTAATAHIQQQIYLGVETCVVCHGAGSVDGLDAKSAHGKLLP